MENKINIGDIYTMKKPHACGGQEWEVIRIGVDLKLKCTKCGHEIIMNRIDFLKKIKKKKVD